MSAAPQTAARPRPRDCPTRSPWSGGSSTACCAPSRSAARKRSSTAAGSCPAWSTRTATSGSASTAPSNSTRRSPRPRPNATSARCCCATPDRRSTPAASTTAHDLPRIIRAGRHLARPKRYQRGFAIELDDESQLPDAVAEQARCGDGWVKLVGDWIDRDVGDLAPLWSDVVLEGGDRRRARQRRPRHRARVQRGRAARAHQRRHRLHRARHRADRRHRRADGRARHRAGAHADQHRELSWHRRRGREVPGLRQAHARPVRAVLSAHRRRPRGRACRSMRAPTRAARSRTAASPTRSTRSRPLACVQPRRWLRRAGMRAAGLGGPAWSTELPPTWSATPRTRARAPAFSTTRRS